MQTWEYQLNQVKADTLDCMGGGTLRDLLDTFGLQGWELTSTVPMGIDNWVLYVFKRPLPSKSS